MAASLHDRASLLLFFLSKRYKSVACEKSYWLWWLFSRLLHRLGLRMAYAWRCRVTGVLSYTPLFFSVQSLVCKAVKLTGGLQAVDVVYMI